MASIYVQPLGAYTQGKLAGAWVDIDGLDESEISEEVQAVLDKSPVKGDEEWRIADYEDMPNMGEYPDFATLAGVVEAIDEASEGAVKTYIDHVGEHYFTAEGFQDAYIGTYKDAEDFGWEQMESMGDVPEFWKSYIDVERFARDLLMGDYFGDDSSDGFHVFSAH